MSHARNLRRRLRPSRRPSVAWRLDLSGFDNRAQTRPLSRASCYSYPGPETTDTEMKSRPTPPARPGARKPAASRRPAVPNPFPLATRRLAKRILQFTELPEPERTHAYNTWLNSAGSPKRNAERQQRVHEFNSLMQAIAKKLGPRDRARLRVVGNAILTKAPFNQSKATRRGGQGNGKQR